MSARVNRAPYIWESSKSEDGDSQRHHLSAQALAELRRGIGREPGTVPEMWRHYVTFNSDEAGQRGEVSRQFAAEHVALALYGLHQQGQTANMHQAGVSLGKAMARLKAIGGFSSDALDRRFNSAATATSQHELTLHLRSLVTLLRGAQIRLDYSRLLRDIQFWDFPDAQARVRRAWGHDYFGWSDGPNSEKSESQSSSK